MDRNEEKQRRDKKRKEKGKQTTRDGILSPPLGAHTGVRCTHQYAVTKASQIGNSFSQFRFNDHRGNVNVSDVAGVSLYSLLASIFVLHDGTGREGDGRLCDMLSARMKSDERQRHCRLPPKKETFIQAR